MFVIYAAREGLIPKLPLRALETVEGTPAEPSSFSSAMPNWGPGETIHFGHKTMRVVAVRGDDSDETRVLVVEDMAE